MIANAGEVSEPDEAVEDDEEEMGSEENGLQE